jgi:hypothetical protein
MIGMMSLSIGMEDMVIIITIIIIIGVIRGIVVIVVIAGIAGIVGIRIILILVLIMVVTRDIGMRMSIEWEVVCVSIVLFRFDRAFRALGLDMSYAL